ncbi:MAG: carbohydrate ABC transporter permease [Anaerolineae bacterium]|nr:carbohydrate ABC transporter permease [Anaerolineae bacterium]
MIRLTITQQHRATLVISYAIIIVAVIIFLFPIVWLALGSLKPPVELMTVSLPSTLTLTNYETVLSSFPVGRYLVNSFIVAFGSTVLSLVSGSLAAFGFVRYRFRARQFLLLFTLLMRMLPAIAISIPLYLLFSRIGLTDTFPGLIIAHAATQLPLVIWIMVGFLEDIPTELADAGLVDGCNRLSVLYHIILPIAAPGMAVGAIFAFLASWNDFGLSLVLISTPERLTMPVGMSQMNLLYGVRWDSLSAAAMMYIIPTIILALVLQRYIVRGLTMGAVKG